MCIRDRISTDKRKINSVTINTFEFPLQYLERYLNTDISKHTNWLSSQEMIFNKIISRIEYLVSNDAVSYTHLDVYKRQHTHTQFPKVCVKLWGMIQLNESLN